MGQQFSLTMKRMHPNKELMEISHPQMGVVMKQAFDGTTGYAAQMGQQKTMGEAEIATAKTKTSIFEELTLDLSKTTLVSLTTVEGQDAYKLKVEGSDVPEFRFYDAKSGYLLRTETTKKEGGNEIAISTDFSNYTPTSGIQFPFSMTTKQGPQTFGMLINKVIVNKEVTDADFK